MYRYAVNAIVGVYMISPWGYDDTTKTDMDDATVALEQLHT